MDKDNSIAEFARSSGRGLRQVKNFIQDAKGMCKKNIPHTLEDANRIKAAHIKPRRPKKDYP